MYSVYRENSWSHGTKFCSLFALNVILNFSIETQESEIDTWLLSSLLQAGKMCLLLQTQENMYLYNQ